MAATRFLVLFVIVASVETLYGHPGRLDKRGGHHDRKTGTYHFHRKVSAAPAPRSTGAAQELNRRATSAQRSRPWTPTRKVTRPAEFKVEKGDTFTATIERAIDGDTFVVKNEQGEQAMIRLAAIDAPEALQPFGREAKRYAEKLVGEDVLCSSLGHDKYRRAIAVVKLKGQTASINRKMVGEGLAWHYLEHSKSKKLATAQAIAKRKKLGLWAEPDPIPPWEWRDSVRDRGRAVLHQVEKNAKIFTGNDPVVVKRDATRDQRQLAAVTNARKFAALVFTDSLVRTYFTAGTVHVVVTNKDGSMTEEHKRTSQRLFEELVMESTGVQMRCKIEVQQ